jgi:hypothetical protein
MTSELIVRSTPAAPVETEPVEAPAAEPLRPDHVRSHSMRCYWDFVDCRWRCARD